MYGWTGKLLRVDLHNEDFKIENIPDELLHDYIGGRGLGVKLYCDMVSADIAPFSDENPLVFTVGPLTGTAPMSGRHTVVSKSPLTSTIFDSNSGGFWGKELKYAGYDALVVYGKSEYPVILKIKDENVSIEKTSLWGKNVDTVTQKLNGEGSVATIGHAGERQVLYASIMNDLTHAAGRGGLGAIMGAKNLKAIVVKGTKKQNIADVGKYKEAMMEMVRLLDASPPINKGLRIFGTAMLYDIVNYLDVMPTDNFNRVHYDGGDKLSGDYIVAHYDIRHEGCWGCPIKCKKQDKNRGIELPEYETIWAFGPNIENGDYEKIVQANIRCNRNGMDTITTGATISMWRELKNENYIERVDEMIDHEELKLGSMRIAKKYGEDKKRVDIKGMELPGYDPRGLYGQALSYATSNRGGCHLRAYMVAPEIIGKPKLIHRLSPEGKAGLVVIFQNLNAAMDSLVLCKFTGFAMTEVEYAKLLSAATGVNYRGEDILRIGDRIYNMERWFNVQAGFTGSDDTLPEKAFMGEHALSRGVFDKMLSEYYEFREWDNGIPTKKKLKNLKIL